MANIHPYLPYKQPVSRKLDACALTSENDTCRHTAVPNRYPGQTCELPGIVDRQRLEIWSGPNEENLGESEHNSCNPINLATGNKFYKVKEYSDNLFVFNRYYNSEAGGWSFSCDDGVLPQPEPMSTITNFRGAGYSHYYGATLESFSRAIISSDGKNDILVETGEDNQNPDIESEYVSKAGSRVSVLNSGLIEVVSRTSFDRYDDSGRLIYREIFGQTFPITITYEDNVKIIRRHTKQIKVTYNQYGRTEKVEFPDSTSIVIFYDEVQRVRIDHVDRMDSEGTLLSSVSYKYEAGAEDKITKVIDELGKVISSVEYDGGFKAIASEKFDGDKSVEKISVDFKANDVSEVINAKGKKSTLTFDRVGEKRYLKTVEGEATDFCLASVKEFQYDSMGNITKRVKANGVIDVFQYNEFSLETSRTEAFGTPQARTITTEWHPDLNLPVRIIEPERETLIAYDANGQILSRQIRPVVN